jgi:RNA polymerase sigma-B factor
MKTTAALDLPTSVDPTAPGIDAAQIDEWVAAYQVTRDADIADRLIRALTPIADLYARRYQRSGAAREDLRQTALVAILRAIDRFDSSLGVHFTSFASRTVEGELKRFHRDRTWAVRPTRRAQEAYLRVRTAQEDLTQQLGRVPTVDDLAAHLDEPADDIIEAFDVGYTCRTAMGVAEPDERDPDGYRLLPTGALGVAEEGYDTAEWHLLLVEAMESLSDEERQLIHMRFFEERTQKDIADELGLSQSYLSRVLRGIFDRMQASMVEDHDARRTA